MISPNSTAPFAPPSVTPDGGLAAVIVKSDLLVAESIRTAVSRSLPQVAHIVVCRTAVEALAVLRRAPAWLALVGLTLLDMDGRDLVELILSERLAERLCVVSGRRDERTRELLRGKQIAGYIDSTRESPAVLKDALRQIAAGRPYFSPIPEGTELAANTPALGQVLSPTELQVLAVVGEGLDDVGAASRLGMSEHTVRTHRQRIMHKLGVRTSRELIFAAIRRGVIRVLPDRILHPGLERALAERSARAAHHGTTEAAGVREGSRHSAQR